MPAKRNPNKTLCARPLRWPGLFYRTTGLPFTDKVLMFENDGGDTTIAILKSVADGKYEKCPLKGEVAFFPEKYAEMLLPIAEKLIAGEPVEKYNHTLKGWLTADTIYEIYPD